MTAVIISKSESPQRRPYGLVFFTSMGTPIHPPIPISTTYDIASKGRGHQRRHRQRAPIDSHGDRYANCVVTSGSVSQMRGQPQSQTALGAVLKGLLGALEQCRHITAP